MEEAFIRLLVGEDVGLTWGLHTLVIISLRWDGVGLEATFITSTFIPLTSCDHKQGKTGIIFQMWKRKVREVKGLA